MRKWRTACQSLCRRVREGIKKTGEFFNRHKLNLLKSAIKNKKNTENKANSENSKNNENSGNKNNGTSASQTASAAEGKNTGAYRSRLMKKKQQWVGLSILVIFILLALVFHALLRSATATVPPSAGEKAGFDSQGESTSVDGVLSTDFTEKNTLSALEQQQQEMDRLTHLVTALRESAEKKAASPDLGSTPDKAALVQQITAILAEREAREKNGDANQNKGNNETQNGAPAIFASGKKPLNFRQGPYATEWSVNGSTASREQGAFHSLNNPPMPLSVMTFSYTDNSTNARKVAEKMEGTEKTQRSEKTDSTKKTGKTAANYVPAGTFATGVLLEGADANASVNGQSDTVGILVRLLDSGTLPNGHHSHLRGCFVLASLYGDISSERGEARLTTLSCTRANGEVLERSVRGYLSFAGKEGIKGHPVMRNGKILAMAGFSGMLSGFGTSLQQASQTQSTSALGTTATVDSGALLQNGLANGASTAMAQLAHYYIQRADQYHPVIEIGSGTVATVIFQAGFSLIDPEDKSVTENSGAMNAFDEHAFQAAARDRDAALFSPTNTAVSNDVLIHDDGVDDLVREAQSLSPTDRVGAVTAEPFADNFIE